MIEIYRKINMIKPLPYTVTTKCPHSSITDINNFH